MENYLRASSSRFLGGVEQVQKFLNIDIIVLFEFFICANNANGHIVFRQFLPENVEK